MLLILFPTLLHLIFSFFFINKKHESHANKRATLFMVFFYWFCFQPSLDLFPFNSSYVLLLCNLVAQFLRNIFDYLNLCSRFFCHLGDKSWLQANQKIFSLEVIPVDFLSNYHNRFEHFSSSWVNVISC